MPKLGRVVWDDCSTGRRRNRAFRRSIHPRIDTRSESQNSCRVRARHADIPGTGHRRADAGIDCIYQITVAECRRNEYRRSTPSAEQRTWEEGVDHEHTACNFHARALLERELRLE